MRSLKDIFIKELEKNIRTLFVLFFCLVSAVVCGQINLLKNGSFELDDPGGSVIPKAWIDFGDYVSSPPAIHSNRTNLFSVHRSAYHGNNFLGMVGRKNGTYEMIGQQLADTLWPGVVYSISFWASFDKTHINVYDPRGYKSTDLTAVRHEILNNNPDAISVGRPKKGESSSRGSSIIRLKKPLTVSIAVGKDMDTTNALIEVNPVEIFTTEVIDHAEWKFYEKKFMVTEEMDVLVLKVTFAQKRPYWGNVLIDDVRLVKIEQ